MICVAATALLCKLLETNEVRTRNKKTRTTRLTCFTRFSFAKVSFASRFFRVKSADVGETPRSQVRCAEVVLSLATKSHKLKRTWEQIERE
jgi:hypothetical protein